MGSIGNQVPLPLLEQHAEPHVAGQGSLAAPTRRVRAAAAGSSANTRLIRPLERLSVGTPCSTPGTSVAALAALACRGEEPVAGAVHHVGRGHAARPHQHGHGQQARHGQGLPLGGCCYRPLANLLAPTRRFESPQTAVF